MEPSRRNQDREKVAAGSADRTVASAAQPQVAVYEIPVHDCPYCGEDHGFLDFIGVVDGDEASALCPDTCSVLIAEKER